MYHQGLQRESPPNGPARAWEPTRRALRRISWRVNTPFLLSFACLPLAIWSVTIADAATTPSVQKWGNAGFQLGLIAFLIATPMFATAVWIQRRRRRALREPWTVWPITYIRTNQQEWVKLIDSDGNVAGTLLVSTSVMDHGKLINQNTPHIWFAGNPQRYGVISLDGVELRYAYRPWGRPAV